MRPRGIRHGSGRNLHRFRLTSSKRTAGGCCTRWRRWRALSVPKFILVGNSGYCGRVGRICIWIHEYGRANRRSLDGLPHALDCGTVRLDGVFPGRSGLVSARGDRLACGGSTENFVANAKCQGARSNPNLKTVVKLKFLDAIQASQREEQVLHHRIPRVNPGDVGGRKSHFFSRLSSRAFYLHPGWQPCRKPVYATFPAKNSAGVLQDSLRQIALRERESIAGIETRFPEEQCNRECGSCVGSITGFRDAHRRNSRSQRRSDRERGIAIDVSGSGYTW